jgi:hypothetical protein
MGRFAGATLRAFPFSPFIFSFQFFRFRFAAFTGWAKFDGGA